MVNYIDMTIDIAMVILVILVNFGHFGHFRSFRSFYQTLSLTRLKITKLFPGCLPTAMDKTKPNPSPVSEKLKAVLDMYSNDIDLVIYAIENEIIRRGLSNVNKLRFEQPTSDTATIKATDVNDIWSF